MKPFHCSACQHTVLFHDTQCGHCQRPLGYDPEQMEILSFEKHGEFWLSDTNAHSAVAYKPCYNYHHYAICNWMLPADSEAIYCRSCQFTSLIPCLDEPQHILYWRSLEQAKQRFLYLTQQLQIFPKPKKNEHDHLGLSFQFLMPQDDQPVLTGHAHGLITLNASEADVVFRETTRVNMGENYRTLLGHFRHESGHYYLDLIQHRFPEHMQAFRECFGDERTDYQLALAKHYQDGPPAHWQSAYVSGYASSHPWEDWAETWAHYLHMMDTLETAYYHGLSLQHTEKPQAKLHFESSPIGALDFEHTLKQWQSLTHTLNCLNQSMGLPDAYPFKLSEVVLNKLRFIHHHILDLAFDHPIVRSS